MTTQTTELEELHERLRAWARGSLPCQAAVEFLIGTGTLRVGHSMIRDTGRVAWPNVFVDEDDPGWWAWWADRTGCMSSGERATWELVRSILTGELEDLFWRLDGDRKVAFARALLANG